MVPDCVHGQNKNIMGKLCKTTAWIKTTGVESKNLTPYKNLMGHYLKNAVQIKTTGVWLILTPETLEVPIRGRVCSLTLELGKEAWAKQKRLILNHLS